MSPTDHEVDLIAYITCRQCTHTYTDVRLLPCMHSFCLQCLHTIYAQQHGTHHQGAAPDHSTDDHQEREPGDQESVHSMVVHSGAEQEDENDDSPPDVSTGSTWSHLPRVMTYAPAGQNYSPYYGPTRGHMPYRDEVEGVATNAYQHNWARGSIPSSGMPRMQNHAIHELVEPAIDYESDDSSPHASESKVNFDEGGRLHGTSEEQCANQEIDLDMHTRYVEGSPKKSEAFTTPAQPAQPPPPSPPSPPSPPGMQTDDDGATSRDEQRVFVNGEYIADSVLRCPVCHYDIVLNKNKGHVSEIDHLPKNEFVQKLVDSFKQLNPYSQGKEVKCGNCGECCGGNNEIPTGKMNKPSKLYYCYQCVVTLCVSCYKAHGTMSSSKKHKTVKLPTTAKNNQQKKQPVTRDECQQAAKTTTKWTSDEGPSSRRHSVHGMPNASGSMNRQMLVSSLTTFRRSQPPSKESTHQQDKVATINSHPMKAQQLLQPNEASNNAEKFTQAYGEKQGTVMGPIEFTETVDAAAAEFTADTYKNSSDVCVTHKNSLVQLYCIDCEHGLCSECRAGEHHQHNCVDIDSKVTASYQLDLRHTDVLINQHLEKTRATIGQGHLYLSEAQQRKDDLHHAIDKKCRELYNMLDLWQEQLMSTVKEVSSDEKTNVENYNRQLGHTLSRLETIASHSKMLQHCGRGGDLMQGLHGIKKQLHQIHVAGHPTVLYTKAKLLFEKHKTKKTEIRDLYGMLKLQRNDYPEVLRYDVCDMSLPSGKLRQKIKLVATYQVKGNITGMTADKQQHLLICTGTTKPGISRISLQNGKNLPIFLVKESKSSNFQPRLVIPKQPHAVVELVDQAEIDGGVRKGCGHLAFCDGDIITVYNEYGEVQCRIEDSQKPRAMTVNNQNNLLVLESDARTLSIYDVKLEKCLFRIPKQEPVEVSNEKIKKKKNHQKQRSLNSSQPPHIKKITDVATNVVDNSIIVCDEGRVVQYSQLGEYVRHYDGTDKHAPQPLVHPTGVCTDNCGNVIVSDFGSSSVYMFTSDLRMHRTLLTDLDIHNPTGVIVDSKQRLIVAEAGGKVKVFNYRE